MESVPSASGTEKVEKGEEANRLSSILHFTVCVTFYIQKVKKKTTRKKPLGFELAKTGFESISASYKLFL